MCWDKLPKTCLLHGVKRLDHLRFCHADVFDEIEEAQEHDFHRLSSVALILGTNLQPVKKLTSHTDGGPWLKPVEPGAFGKLAGAAYVSQAEIERFKSKYLTSGLIGRMFGINWNVASRILKQKGVDPVIDPKWLGADVYRRHEVLSVAKGLAAAQPLLTSVQRSGFKVKTTSKFSDENDEKGETDESNASIL